jgi:hypothetical protein
MGCADCIIMPPSLSAYLNLPTVSSVSGSIRMELLVVSVRVRHSTWRRPSSPTTTGSGSTALLGLSVSAAPVRVPTTLRTRSSRLLLGGHCENSRRTGRPLALADV